MCLSHSSMHPDMCMCLPGFVDVCLFVRVCGCECFFSGCVDVSVFVKVCGCECVCCDVCM